VEKVIVRLIRQWLVRRLDDDKSYELTHDVLAAAIADWIGDEDRQVKQVQEMLRRELADWQQDHNVLPGRRKFQRINSVRHQLRLTADETALLLRTAILYDEAIAYWLAQVAAPALQVEILVAMLKSEMDQARLAAAAALANFPGDNVALALADTALADPDQAVRETAAMSVGSMGSRAGIDRLTGRLLDREHEERDEALRALALIQDTAPGRLLALPASLRRPIYIELAKFRFWRHWPQIRMTTTVGAAAGMVGFALMLTPFLILQWLALFSDSAQVIQDIPFIVTLSALFGLIAGSGLAFGISAGRALSSTHNRMGRVLGGALLGGVSFAVAFSPFILGSTTRPLPSLAIALLFGAMVGFGITAPSLANLAWPAQLVGGVMGAALGMLFFVAFYNPVLLSSTVNIATLVVSGGLFGLIMAFTISSAEARWPGEEIKTVQVLRWEEAPSEGIYQG
jgi:HEAT repeat protein